MVKKKNRNPDKIISDKSKDETGKKQKKPALSNIVSESLTYVGNSFDKLGNSIKRGLKRFWGLVLKELAVIKKDRIAMIIAFMIPTVTIIMLGTGGIGGRIRAQTGTEEFAGRGAPPNEKPIVGIVDYDRSELSAEFIDLAKDYERTGYVTLVFVQNVSTPQEQQTILEEMLGKNEINAIIIIPELFEYNLSIHFPALIGVVFDTIDADHLQTAQEFVDKLVNEFRYTHGFTGVFHTEFIEVGVPESEGARTLFVASPIFFPLILFSIGSLVASQSIVSDIPKDRMVLTPANKYEILAAKLVGLQIFMSILTALTLSLSIAFGLPIRSNIFMYFGILSVLSLSGVVWGLFVSALAEEPLNALQYFIFMFLFMSIVLLFVEDPNLLRWIPIHNGNKLLMNVTLRGEPLAWNLGYLTDTLFELAILYILTQIIFNKRKNLL